MFSEVVQQPIDRYSALLDHAVQQVEDGAPLVASRHDRGIEAGVHQVERSDTQQVLPRGKPSGERWKQSLAAAFQSTKEAQQTAPGGGGSQMTGCRIFQMMSLVEHEARVRRQHRRIVPLLGGSAYGQIRQEQMVIDDDHIGLRRLPPGGEEKALVEVRTLQPKTQIGLRRHFIPDVGLGRRGEVAQTPVTRARRPFGEPLHLSRRPRIEERRPRPARLIQPIEADVVVPPLEQREAHRLIVQRADQEGEILADQLLLQVDGVGRHHGALPVLRRPAQRGNQVA